MNTNLVKNSKKISVGLIPINNHNVLSRNFRLITVTTQALILQNDKQPCYFSEKEILKLIDEPVELFLSQYEYFFYGQIRSIKKLQGDKIQVEVCFMDNAPSYYRECVRDLLN